MNMPTEAVPHYPSDPKPPFPEQTQELPGSFKLMNPRPDHGEQSWRGAGRLNGMVALITGVDSCSDTPEQSSAPLVVIPYRRRASANRQRRPDNGIRTKRSRLSISRPGWRAATACRPLGTKRTVADFAEQCAGVVHVQNNLHGRAVTGSSQGANGQPGEQAKAAAPWGQSRSVPDGVWPSRTGRRACRKVTSAILWEIPCQALRRVMRFSDGVPMLLLSCARKTPTPTSCAMTAHPRRIFPAADGRQTVDRRHRR